MDTKDELLKDLEAACAILELAPRDRDFICNYVRTENYRKVVLCGECKWWEHIGCDVHICGRPKGGGRPRNHYCSKGEPKEGE